MKRARLLFGISVGWLALSMLFDGMNTLVLPAYLLGAADEATRGTTLGLMTFTGIVLGMLVQPVAGALSDRLRPRWGRRGMIALGTLLTLLALGIFGVAHGLALIFLGYLLVQGAASVAQAAQQGFIPDLVPARLRGAASGIKGFMDLAGAMLGFAVLGALLEGQPGGPALWAVAGVVVVTAALTLALVREPRLPAHSPPLRASLRDAFRIDLRRQRTFVQLVVARFLFLLGTYAVGRFLLYFVADRLGLGAGSAAEATGGLLAGLALLTALGAPLAGWASDRFGRMPLMLLGALLSTAGILSLTVASSAMLIFLFGSLMALGSAAFASANWAFTADVTPPDEGARFFGLANIGTAGAAAAAGLLGPLVDWGNARAPGAGYTALFVVAGLACAASALALRGISAPRPLPPAGSRGRVPPALESERSTDASAA
jgi:MFS family permease